jgi:hypothetical protein
MAPDLDRADQAGPPCYLTTAKRENVGFTSGSASWWQAPRCR